MQQQPHHGSSIATHGGGGSLETHHHYNHQHQFRSDYPALAQAPVSADGGGTTTTTSSSSSSSSSSVKPGCMIELARLAKIPPPASGLMCPRCDSTDTKFCYYNNYSLSQPRHFCKTCRRYWTHGGAIRDIPLSSTIRRRLTKPSSSKHTITTASKQSACAASATGRTPSCWSSGAVPTIGRVAAVAAAATTLQPPPPPPPPLLVAPFGPVCAEQQLTSGSSSRRLWFPGHSSEDPVHDHQLGNRRGAAAIKVEQQCWYLPKRQHLSFFSYTNGVIAPTMASVISQFSAEFGGAEAAGFAAGQMKAVSRSRVPGSGSSSSVMMMEEHPPSTKMGAELTSSPTQVTGLQQGEDDELHYFLGTSGGSWTCSNGGGTDTGSGGTAAPGNVSWAEDCQQASFTSSTSWNIL